MDLEMRTAAYLDLGITDYNKVFRLQSELASKRAKNEIQDTIIITEHNPLINFGIREVHNSFSDYLYGILKEKNIEISEENAIKYLKEIGIGFSRTSRGGGATFIGKGQLNIYPIVAYESITKNIFDVNGYKKIIDEIMDSVLKSYGLKTIIHKDTRKDDEEAEKSNRKDIWIEIGNKSFKLGGKGIHFSNGIAYHGFNFYVKKGCTDGFKYVNPCGYTSDELGVISIEEAIGKEIKMEDFKKRVVKEIKNRFNYNSFEEIKDFKIFFDSLKLSSDIK